MEVSELITVTGSTGYVGGRLVPELLQNECNAKEIYKSVVYFLKNPDLAKKQVDDCIKTLDQIRSKSSSSDEAAKILSKYLVA